MTTENCHCHDYSTGAVAAKVRWHIMGRVNSTTWHKVEYLKWPVDWPAIFGRSGPLLIEIGFGSGLFIAALARARPEANILGIEISIPSLRNAGRKIQRGGLDNVLLIQADARSALTALCSPGSVDGVFINYPDPWPKKDQVNRRLINDDFLDLVASRLKEGGFLDIATDHEAYAAQIEECLQKSLYFTNPNGFAHSHLAGGRISTKYEQVALSEGRRPYYFLWVRSEEPISRLFPPPEEFNMPHVVVRVPASLDEIGHRFQPLHVEDYSMRIRFIDVYQSVSDGKLMIETYIVEDAVQQRIGIEIRSRATGEVVISLAELGFPRPTRGVHLAIGTLVDWLRETYPSTIVVQSTLARHHADTSDKRN